MCKEHRMSLGMGRSIAVQPQEELRMTHTPGPWTFDAMELVLDKDERIIADLSPCNADGEKLDNAVYYKNQQEAEANAHLIAAAPALLHELKRQAKEWHNDNCETRDIEVCPHSKCLEASQLIAHAEGRT